MEHHEDIERYLDIMGKGCVNLAFWKASKAGNCNLIKTFFRRGAKLDWKNKDYHDYTALHVACQKGQDEVVRTLVGYGADVNALGSSHETPLHEAAHGKHELIALFLLTHGAKINQITKYHKTPIDFAKHNKFFTALQNAQNDVTAKSRKNTKLLKDLSYVFFSSCCAKVNARRMNKLYNGEKQSRLRLEAENRNAKCTILKVESQLAEKELEISDLKQSLLLSEKELERQRSIYTDQVKMADSRRRKLERSIAEGDSEIRILEEQLVETKRLLEESYQENKQLEHFISTSIAAVVAKNTRVQMRKAKTSHSPRTIKLRTLKERLEDAEDRAFNALESKEQAEKHIEKTAAYLNQVEDELSKLREWKQQKTKKESAIKIQATFRGRKTRKLIEMEHKETERNTIKIQARFRGAQTRKRICERRGIKSHASLIKLQAHIRGGQTRKALQKEI